MKQLAIVGLGTVLALIMIFLGLWQMQVFVDKGNRTVQDRAEQPPVALLDYVHADGTVGDIYGKRASVTGRYLPDRQLRIVADDGDVRLLTAFQLADGRILPIVRGQTTDPASAPPAPAGERTVTGLFLPGEGDSSTPVGPGELASVRTPLIAQQWPERILPGFLTLDADAARAQGLAHGEVSLPQGDGSFQNGGYALQWWVFAAFALGMSIKFAHDIGARERRRLEDEATTQLDDFAQPSA